MIQITHENNGSRFLLVEVPSSKYVIIGIKDNLLTYVPHFQIHEVDINLPAGEWSIIGIAENLSEDEAKDIVSCLGIIYKNYISVPINYAQNILKTAIESLQSLCLSHKLNPKNTLILKQI